MRIVYCIVSLLSVCTSFVLYAACEEVKLVPTQYPSDSVTRVFNVNDVPHRTKNDENLEKYNHLKWYQDTFYNNGQPTWFALGAVTAASLGMGRMGEGVADYFKLNRFSSIGLIWLSCSLPVMILNHRMNHIIKQVTSKTPKVNLNDVYNPSNAYLEKQGAFLEKVGIEGGENLLSTREGMDYFELEWLRAVAEKIIISDPKNAVGLIKELPYMFLKGGNDYSLYRMEKIMANEEDNGEVYISMEGHRPFSNGEYRQCPGYYMKSKFHYNKKIKKADSYPTVFFAHAKNTTLKANNSDSANNAMDNICNDYIKLIAKVIDKNYTELNYPKEYVIKCSFLCIDCQEEGMTFLQVYQNATGSRDEWCHIHPKKYKKNTEKYHYLCGTRVEDGKVEEIYSRKKKIAPNTKKAI